MKPQCITVHCSATITALDVGVSAIRDWHLDKGWSDIGYHFVIRRSGLVEKGRPLTRSGAHVKGHNKNNVGICLVGGLGKDHKPECNYTQEQFTALRELITELCGQYGIRRENIVGHRDWFPDINGDGVVDDEDWLKACPCFDVQQMLNEWESAA
ncbi:N-acetylmuramoyl-L-alanine amidase [Veronia pacifica]|uniref:N-acetylmuramoyl-L-alanine amidase n=1 Tax=Veronia pacifica TaxID=1080227 RepID=A0A1C3E9B8_9GAMM|nr:N-acetylmuramoyl-L-alanine amidase [Veronia pacifica]ODA29867.1 hypothetical protein A8L45_21445 [Veronia pacifica]